MLKTVENCLLGMKLMGLQGPYGSLPHTFEIQYIKEIFKVGLASEKGTNERNAKQNEN